MSDETAKIILDAIASDGQVLLSWDLVNFENVTKVQVFKIAKLNDGKTDAKIRLAILKSGETSYTDENTSGANECDYHITATNDSGDLSSEIVTVIIGDTEKETIEKENVVPETTDETYVDQPIETEPVTDGNGTILEMEEAVVETVVEPKVEPVVDKPTVSVETTTGFIHEGADEVVIGRINTYIDLVTVPGAARSNCIRAFSNIFRYVLGRPTTANLDAVKAFFEKHNKTLLGEAVALQGITTLPMKERNKVEVLYTVFRELTTTKRKLNTDQIRKVCGDAVVTWRAKNNR